jgi:pimeloyl-ACP methyl ester carboxylesterase
MSNADSDHADAQMLSSRLEIISRLPAKPRLAPPLVFVHGAWHGAWCWEDHFLDYFADLGFACYALNLRGHGASKGTRDVRFCRVRHFVEDLEEAVASIGAEPVLIGHSLGGFVVQKYLEKHSARLGVLLGSIPPHGGLRMVKRLMRGRPLDVLRSNLVFSLKPLFSNARKVRALLFDANTPQQIVENCADRLQDDTIVGLFDYVFLNLVNVSKVDTQMLVFGAAEDSMIDAEDVAATGRAYGRTPIFLPRVGHDMMIDGNWERAAKTIASEIIKELGVEARRGFQMSNVA